MPDLTHAQVLKMEAGPELDALVAERVMRWEQRWYIEDDDRDHYVRILPPDSKYVEEHAAYLDWSPSTDIAAAMTVLEKWADPERHGGYGEGGIFWEGSRDDWTWCCELGVVAKTHAPTAPLAICRAALLTTL